MPEYSYDLPSNYYFGGGGDTHAPLLAVILLAVSALLILLLPRKYAFVPLLIAAMLVPGVTFVVAQLHFTSLRLLILVGLVRAGIRRKLFPGRFSQLDQLILVSILANAIMFSLLWRDTGAVINRLGIMLTYFGGYYVMRCLVRDKRDVVRVIKTFAVILLLIAPVMLRETLTDRNLFSMLGGQELSDMRHGLVRASGPFAHAVIAGTVGAMLLPLFVGLWWYERKSRWIAAAGVLSSLVMALSAASATPMITLPVAIVGLAMWPARKEMKKVRWGIVGLVIVMQLFMKSPVWFVLGRLGSLFGSSGWHRAMLIDNFIRHFPDWWLVGTRDNTNWGWDMWDVDNAYVGAGLAGGLLCIILFIAVQIQAFRVIGEARRALEHSRRDARLVWAIGAALFANTIAFFGIVYFDQSILAWYTLLAVIAQLPNLAPDKAAAATEPVLKPKAASALVKPFPIPEVHGVLFR